MSTDQPTELERLRAMVHCHHACILELATRQRAVERMIVGDGVCMEVGGTRQPEEIIAEITRRNEEITMGVNA